MKVKIQQFLFSSNHSWAHVGKEIGRSLLKNGHDVHFVSMNNKMQPSVIDKFVPEDLREHIKNVSDKEYDCQISYTAMQNFPTYLANGTKNRFGIWNYEFEDFKGSGFPKYHMATDKFLPSSKFFYDICIKNGIPAEKMQIVPHGVNANLFLNAEPMVLKTQKKYKILLNIAQPHIRKNLAGTLEAFGLAFTKNDDVCFVIKVVDKKPESLFEISFSEVFAKFKKKFPNHAECLILKDYIPNIESLYKSCDIFFHLSHAEAYHLPACESLISGMVVFSSRYGGALNYLNDDNSFLIDGKMVRAPREAQYWTPSVYSGYFQPDLKQAAEKLAFCVKNFEEIKKQKLASVTREFIKSHSWDAQIKLIEGLCV